jgi:hypothetical protein
MQQVTMVAIVTYSGAPIVKTKSKHIRQEMVVMMRTAGIPPHLIYAYERTGLLLMEDGYKNLSTKDKAEYDAAIDEYFAKDSNK